MDKVSSALLFWQLVEVSLVELYLWEPVAAHDKVLQLRGRMTEAAIAQDVTYHLQPLQVAGDIANVFEPISDSVLNAYQRLEKRITAQWSRDAMSEEEGIPKSRLNASRGSRAVAALAR
jgi:hypothetical protein